MDNEWSTKELLNSKKRLASNVNIYKERFHAYNQAKGDHLWSVIVSNSSSAALTNLYDNSHLTWDLKV